MSTKNANANAGTKTKTSKNSKKKVQKANLKKTNLKVAAEEVKAERELKYIYPKDKMDKKEKKDFRRQMRGKNASFQKQIEALTGKKDPESKKKLATVQKAYDAFKLEHYTKPA